jgi:hypothetical protein
VRFFVGKNMKAKDIHKEMLPTKLDSAAI